MALKNPTIAWENAGDAQVVSAAGVQVVLRSTRPYPPGAPVQGTLATASGPKIFTLKVAGSRKVAEDVWEVRGRLLTATVDLIAAFAAAATDTSSKD